MRRKPRGVKLNGKVFRKKKEEEENRQEEHRRLTTDKNQNLRPREKGEGGLERLKKKREERS